MAERAIADRLTVAYVVGLTFVAVLSGTAHVLIDTVIAQQGDSATVINVAGRQRMLSQRIGLLASDLHQGEVAARQPLLDLGALMQRSEDALIKGGDLGIRHPLSASAYHYYMEGPAPLDPQVRDFVAAAHDFASPRAGSTGEAAYRRLEAAAHATLLPALIGAVSILEEEANRRIEWMRTAQTIVLLVLLITLMLEAMLIFRPLVSKIKRYAETLHDMASRDALTGLTNRRFFMERGNQAVQAARPTGALLSAIVLDLDHFKRINDEFGHAVGDAVLRRFAAIAAGMMRDKEVISRIGGEEFAVLLPGIGLSGATQLAEDLRAAVAEDRCEGLPALTVSLGVSTLVTDDPGIDALLSRADLALYDAKRNGRNRVAHWRAERQLQTS